MLFSLALLNLGEKTTPISMRRRSKRKFMVNIGRLTDFQFSNIHDVARCTFLIEFFLSRKLLYFQNKKSRKIERNKTRITLRRKQKEIERGSRTNRERLFVRFAIAAHVKRTQFDQTRESSKSNADCASRRKRKTSVRRLQKRCCRISGTRQTPGALCFYSRRNSRRHWCALPPGKTQSLSRCIHTRFTSSIVIPLFENAKISLTPCRR